MYKFFFKRFFDFIISLIALPFVLLITLFVAIAIKIDDRGPIFYCGKRIGKNGKLFKMVKFRSMKVNAPDIRLPDGSTYNGEDDPRVTRVGKFLRKTSLDEIPQVFNILVGQMSIIGPRPDTPDWIDKYSEETKIFLKARPGITGYSQAYYRNSVDSVKKMENDVYYVKHLSFWLDVKIFFKTIATVVSRENVYIEDHAQKKKLLILGGSVLQLPAIKKAKELGLYVGIIDYDKNAVGIAFADEYFNVSTIDVDKVVETAKSFKPDGIVTLATDMPMRSIAAACEALKLPGITYQTAVNATDKGEMIKVFDKNNVEHPWFYIIESIEQLQEISKEINYPCIMKPTDNSGSRGVVLVQNKEQLLENYEYSNKQSRGGSVIIEEYMRGPEVSVEIMVIDGKVHVLQVTDKLTTGAPHFVEMGHSQPSRLLKEDVEKIKDLATRAVLAIGVNNGPTHVEIILTDKGPKMVELGARMGGDCITTHLVPLSTGIDMVSATISLSCGEKVDVSRKNNKGSAIRFFRVEPGRITAIEGLENAKKIKQVREITMVKKVGDVVGDIGSSTDRIGYVVCQAKTAEKAVKACEKAMSKIKITVE